MGSIDTLTINKIPVRFTEEGVVPMILTDLPPQETVALTNDLAVLTATLHEILEANNAERFSYVGQVRDEERSCIVFLVKPISDACNLSPTLLANGAAWH